ncbi:hypothetical protein BT69DRAFT_1305947 [Atractiella rhizophila]|nr:hypothetical protein BT69DRAFT_1305947 [Atractiella rhizophila]
MIKQLNKAPVGVDFLTEFLDVKPEAIVLREDGSINEVDALSYHLQGLEDSGVRAGEKIQGACDGYFCHSVFHALLMLKLWDEDGLLTGVKKLVILLETVMVNKRRQSSSGRGRRVLLRLLLIE